MNLVKMGVAIALVGGGLWCANEAKAYDFYISCESGHVNSWKLCEAVTDYPGQKTYQWYGNYNALLASNCANNRRLCSTYCGSGSNSSTAIFVNVLNASGQLVGTASKTIGCIN